MKVEDIDLKAVKYRVTKCDLIIPGYEEPYSIDDAHLGNFTIEKDFEEFVFPYMEFRVIVPDKIYKDVLASGEAVYVDIKVQYTYMDDFYEVEATTAQNMVGTLFDARFYAFIDNRSPKLTDDTLGERNKEKESGNDLTQYSFDNDKAIILMLYRADHMFNTDQVVNKILKRATLADVANYYFKACGIRDLLMSPPENCKMYEEMILPPIPMIGGLLRLSRTYGIHKAGTVYFFDYDRVYILNKKLGATAWQDNEITTVYLTSFPNQAGDDGIMKSGFYVNTQEKYAVINIIGNQISITNQAMFDDVLVGSNVVLIDSSTGEISKMQASLDVNQMSPSKQGKTNMVMMMDSGQPQLDAMKADLEYAQNMLTVVLQETNLQYLTPNKDFIFTTDNSKYSKYCGHYRLISLGSVFTKESSLYTTMITATFVGGKAQL